MDVHTTNQERNETRGEATLVPIGVCRPSEDPYALAANAMHRFVFDFERMATASCVDPEMVTRIEQELDSAAERILRVAAMAGRTRARSEIAQQPPRPDMR